PACAQGSSAPDRGARGRLPASPGGAGIIRPAAAGTPRSAGTRGGVLLRYGVPVDDVPPRLDVVGPPVLVLQVVGVLPDVEAEDRRVAVHDRRVLVRRGVDLQVPRAVHDEPGPARAETAGGLLLEQRLELVEAAERLVDRLPQLTARLPAGVGAHDLPEEVVVHVPA